MLDITPRVHEEKRASNCTTPSYKHNSLCSTKYTRICSVLLYKMIELIWAVRYSPRVDLLSFLYTLDHRHTVCIEHKTFKYTIHCYIMSHHAYIHCVHTCTYLVVLHCEVVTTSLQVSHLQNRSMLRWYRDRKVAKDWNTKEQTKLTTKR